MGVAHVGLVHRDPCECKVKGFRAVSSIERNVSKRGARGATFGIRSRFPAHCSCIMMEEWALSYQRGR